MLRLFVGILVILFLSDLATSQLPNSFLDIPKRFNSAMDEYQEAVQYEDANMMRKVVRKILQKVIESADELYTLDTDWRINCNVLKSLLADQTFETSFQNPTKQLCDNIRTINNIFDHSREYEVDASFGNASFQNFAHEALWGDINISDSLEEIHELFTISLFGPGLLFYKKLERKENFGDDCDTYVSVQQQVYYIYLKFIITELKALVTTQRIYLTKRLVNNIPDNYIGELEYANKNFQAQLDEYYETFTESMDLFPQHVRRCNVKRPKRGINIIELKKFSRFTILDPQLKKNYTCKGCPSTSEIEKISVATNTFIYDCTDLGSAVQICLPKSGSYRDYLWWEDGKGTCYGDNTTCDSLQVIKADQKPKNIWSRYILRTKCTVCACSMDQNKIQKDDDSTIWRISIGDQISDFHNNMVVTGVRFVTHDNALHLQISQANFSQSGQAHNNSSWKKLDIGYGTKGITPTKVKLSYQPLRYNRKSLWLDDITAPEGCAVTGVRFQPAGDSAFKLQILATSFNFETGQLFPFGSGWMDALKNPMRPEDYKQKRIEINLDNSDDPTKSAHFKYDPQSNKLVNFTHTDVHKDAGQTTIPLLDARPVVTKPPFPLSGIGLSYRGSDGFGGYIAPRIYTMNVNKYMESLYRYPNNQNLSTVNPIKDGDNNP